MVEKKVAIATLGCKVNQYDSSALLQLFLQRGYRQVDFGQAADVYIVNTCTVTHLGDKKSRQMIRRAKKTNPDSMVVVTGCYAQTSPGELMDIEDVDLVVGTGDRSQLVDLVESTPRGSRVNAVKDILKAREFAEMPGVINTTRRERAFLKVQEGCNNFCTYCIVPYARGPARSRETSAVLAEARGLLEAGFKEIVLTGIHTGAYGRENHNSGLVDLVGMLRDLPGLVRLRLSSVEPLDISRELLEIMASGPPVCRHLHVPLQSGDDSVLQRMGRHYTTSWYRDLAGEIIGSIPGVALTTDVIAGFPGESDMNFENTYNFIESIKFTGLHVFKYSPRRGTPAADFPDQVHPAIKDKRSSLLSELGEKKAADFALEFLKDTVEVLVEEAPEEGWVRGHTDNYLPVQARGGPELKGQLVKVLLEEIKKNQLYGRII